MTYILGICYNNLNKVKHYARRSIGLTVRIHLMLFGSYAINERKDRSERLGLDMESGEIKFLNEVPILFRKEYLNRYWYFEA
jgi:hypothetical protein